MIKNSLILAIAWGLFLTEGYSQFVRIETDPFISDSTESSGAAWADYNNDGFDDVFINSALPHLPKRFYRNNGDGSFTKIEDLLINQVGQGRDASWGDMDNDGFPDLYITNALNNKLFRNKGDSTFEEVTLANTTDDTNGSAWADFNNDGLLDLVQCSNPTSSTGDNFLYVNSGSNTFDTIVFKDNSTSITPQWIDYNNDGWIDLYIVNYSLTEPNLMYKNDGEGNLQLVEIEGLTTIATFSTGSSWADFDNDGDFDCIIINNANAGHIFFQNNGDGTFSQISNELTGNYPASSSAWVDFDNDGLLDICIAGNHGNFLFRNTGDNFEMVSSSMNVADTISAQSVTWSDYDKDGFPDLLITNHEGPDQLYRNTSNGNNWISIKLNGTNSNKSGIGAKVHIKTDLGWQQRLIETKSGFYSQSSINAAFGIGQAEVIDTILVEWPLKGYQEIIAQEPNQFVEIVEPDFPVIPGNFSREYIQPSTVRLTWSDSSSNESGFRIERSTDGVHYGVVGSVGQNVTEYDDNDLPGGFTYRYRIASTTDQGYSLYSYSEPQFIKSQQIVTFDTIAETAFLAEGALTLNASSSSGYDVSFFVSEGLGKISIDSNAITLLDTGFVEIGAFAPENELFFASDTVYRSFIIIKGQQIVTFDTIAETVFLAVGALTLNASSSSGYDVSFFVSEGLGKISIDSNAITLLDTGFVEIGAFAPENELFFASDTVYRSFIISENTLSVEEWSNSYLVYPNPTSAILTITLKNRAVEKDIEISILTVEGRLLKKQLLDNTETVIDLSEMPPGVYLLQLEEEIFRIMKR